MISMKFTCYFGVLLVSVEPKLKKVKIEQVMSETTYVIENSASGRASCKKCKEKIRKDELRIGVMASGPIPDVTFTR